MTKEQRAVKVFAIILATLIIVSIFSAVVSGVSFIASFFTPYKDINGQLEDVDLSNLDLDDIENISIDLPVADLEIYTGKSFKIEKNASRIRTRISNKTLYIDEKRRFLFHGYDGKIVLYIPEEKKISNLRIDHGTGKMNIKGVEAQFLKIDQGTGSINIEDSLYNHANLDGGVGQINVKNSTIYDLDLDTGIGSVYIEGRLLGKTKIDGGVGSIKLSIDGDKKDYTIAVDNGLGTVSVDGEHLSGKVGSGPNSLDIDGGVGSIIVNFK